MLGLCRVISFAVELALEMIMKTQAISLCMSTLYKAAEREATRVATR